MIACWLLRYQIEIDYYLIDDINCRCRDSPDEFSVAPVIMKDADCSLVDNLIAKKLILQRKLIFKETYLAVQRLKFRVR